MNKIHYKCRRFYQGRRIPPGQSSKSSHMLDGIDNEYSSAGMNLSIEIRLAISQQRNAIKVIRIYLQKEMILDSREGKFEGS